MQVLDECINKRKTEPEAKKGKKRAAKNSLIEDMKPAQDTHKKAKAKYTKDEF